MVEEVEEGQTTSSEDGEEGTPHVEEAREVVNVGPKEYAAGGTCSEGETEEPLEGGFGSPPEPAGVSDLGGGGEDESGEDGDGDEGHEEGVDGGDWAEGDGAISPEKEVEEEMEENGEDDVGEDGGEEEEPRGPIRLGGTPPESDDGGMLRQVEQDGVDRRGGLTHGGDRRPERERPGRR